MDAPTNILAFWRLVEWLTPASFPNVKTARNEAEPVYDIRPHEVLPWDEKHPHFLYRCSSENPGKSSDNSREGWAYGVYAGLLDINTTRIEIESWLGESADHVVRDERQPQGTSAIGFQVDGNGRVIAGTLVVSSFAWAYGTLRQYADKNEKVLRADTLSTDEFHEAEKEILERFSSELSGVQLTAENCDRFMAWLFDRLSLPVETLTLRRCRVQCVRRPLHLKAERPATQVIQHDADAPEAKDGETATKASPAPTEQASPRLTRALEMLNSHYLDDLGLVHDAAASECVGLALEQYLGKHPATRVDVRKEHSEAWALMSPELYPQGRWPTKGRFPLVFSQQLAINHAFRTLGSRHGGLMAVNGPPGTGKTTLLKDVVAGVIVARAQVLAEYSSPDKAFDKTQPAWQSGQWRQPYARIDDKLMHYGIVVVSSNNGAVENVTLEFPKGEDVDPEWGDRAHSPFAEIGSALLRKEQSAWSLLSACLGNSQNRTKFVDALWGWERKEEPGHVRLPALLKGERPKGVPPWRAAVRAFNEALSHEEDCRKKRVQLYKLATSIGPLQLDMKQTRQRIDALKKECKSAESAVLLATESLEETKRIYSTAHRDAQANREAELQQAKMQQEIRKTECERGKIALDSAQEELSLHRQYAPGTLKNLISDWLRPLSSVTEWRHGELTLVKAIANAKQSQATRQGHLAEAMQDVARAEKALSPASLRSEMAREADRLDECRITHKAAERQLRSHKDELQKQLVRYGRSEKKLQEADEKLRDYENQAGANHSLSLQLLLGPADDKELSSPWGDAEWEEARVAVFLAALDLHESFVFDAGKPIQNNLRGMMQLLRGKAPTDLPPGVAESLWASLFLVVPVVSTTFASFSRQFAELGQESIGWLMIDEAGQAAPQQAAGALWRAKSALVVGDPLQLEPIVTVPDRLQATLAESCNVSMDWLPSNTSAQALADLASTHGSMIGETWVGSPLLVHRRCDSPMFDIANEVAYDNAMVHGKPPSKSTLPVSTWIHVDPDSAQGHWIPAEGKAVVSLLEDLIENEVKPEDILLISPFTTVVTKLRKIGYQFPGIKAGTIHTVQGKEAKVVVLVLGGDPALAGAKAWASSTPNLVNVAVSRAKERVYVVADRKAWERYPYFQACSDMLPDALGRVMVISGVWKQAEGVAYPVG